MGADQLPVFQNCHSVCDFKDLVEPMRDVDNTDPEAAHLSHIVEQQIDFSTRDDRRRFIEDKESGLADQRLGDLNHLSIGKREIADPRESRNRHAKPVECGLDALLPRFG
jgi:hypothetical protein